MKPVSIETIYAAKANRRKQLAVLSLEEKVEIMEKLQEMGRTMLSARKQLPAARSSSKLRKVRSAKDQ